MAQIPLATKGNYFHVYDFRVKPGMATKFVEAFEAHDYRDDNPFHHSPAQVKDGVVAQDVDDPDHLYLIGEWSDIVAHAALRKEQMQSGEKPAFMDMIVPGTFKPVYAKIVMSTPQEILDAAVRSEAHT
jgi:hypothetical protein